jgi:hypothetical protein
MPLDTWEENSALEIGTLCLRLPHPVGRYVRTTNRSMTPEPFPRPCSLRPTDRRSPFRNMETEPLPYPGTSAARRPRVSVGWTQWLFLNANNLVWIALVVGGVLFTSLLMKL